MVKYIRVTVLFLMLVCFVQAQISPKKSERFPVFPACENENAEDLEFCFYKQVNDFVTQNFVVPEKLVLTNYKGIVIVIFEVDAAGTFKVQYVDAVEELLIAESKRVFGKFPKISPPTYNGKPTYAKYSIRISIPLMNSSSIHNNTKIGGEAKIKTSEKVKLSELDSISYQKFDNPQFESHLFIPFSHSYYAQFDDEVNQMGANNHTGSKPFSYAEVTKYYNFHEVNRKLLKNKKSWWGRKLWNENLVEIKGDYYWFTLNPVFDLRLGKSWPSNYNYTYVNTRGVQFSGGLGKDLNFTTTIYESQARFADYYNRYAESIKPDGGNPAIIPGIGIAKDFQGSGYDFPSADANLVYAPAKFIDFNLGYGRCFIGDGYRSVLLSDGASPFPYFKLNTTFWKIKYTSIYQWMKDVRPEVTVDRTYAAKYSATHYLSLNVTNRWNIGLFESVVWAHNENRGYDMSFVNPIIFLRSMEFASSARSGNALLGFTSKYKWNNKVNLYGQFLIDEFSSADVFEGDKSWKNKFAYQFGVKWYHALGVENLMLQAEYNQVRPYVYLHSAPITNYGHNNQSLGHIWGANFREFVGIAYYNKGRFFSNLKAVFGMRGFDYDTDEDSFNYGGNIYKDYDENRPYDVGVEVGQGNKTKIFQLDIQAGYLVNPMTNMKLFGGLLYRNFAPSIGTSSVFKENTSWFSVGLRCDLFNWYFDY